MKGVGDGDILFGVHYGFLVFTEITKITEQWFGFLQPFPLGRSPVFVTLPDSCLRTHGRVVSGGNIKIFGLDNRLVGQRRELDRHALTIAVGIVEQRAGGGVVEDVVVVVTGCTACGGFEILG